MHASGRDAGWPADGDPAAARRVAGRAVLRRVLAKDGTVRNAAHFGRSTSTGTPADPQLVTRSPNHSPHPQLSQMPVKGMIW